MLLEVISKKELFTTHVFYLSLCDVATQAQ